MIQFPIKKMDKIIIPETQVFPDDDEVPEVPQGAPKRPKRQPMESTNKAIRHAVFTANGMDPDYKFNTDFVKKVCQQEGIRYLCGQLERGATGNVHWQGYMELENPKRFSSIKKILLEIFRRRCHVEPRKGTAEQARNYCMKEDTRIGSFYEVSQCWFCHNCRFTEHFTLE